MPTSEHWQVPWIVDAIIREQPTTVLDVGSGYGKFGVMVREFTTASRLDAVDAIPPRFAVYDHFYQGDFRMLSALLPPEPAQYDLALFVEAIEHLDKEDGWRVLDEIARRARRVVVSTPFGFRPQEIPGQPFETHRSGWYPWEFRRKYRVHSVRIFPGHLSRHLCLPKLWQFLVVLSAARPRS